MRPATILEDVRAQIALIESVSTRHAHLPFGVDAIDQMLPGGGLAAGALHEGLGSPDLAGDANATVFLAGVLARLYGPMVGEIGKRVPPAAEESATPALISRRGAKPDAIAEGTAAVTR